MWLQAYHLVMRRHCTIVLLALGALLAAVPLVAQQEAADEAQQGSWLGVLMRDADDGGVELLAVIPDGPAFNAGLTAGDVLLEFHGRRVANTSSIEQLLRATRAGQLIRFVALRDGKAIERDLHLADRPARLFPSAPAARHRFAAPDRNALPGPRLGWVIVDVTPDLRQHFGAPDDRGVLVSRLSDGGRADALGIQVGDIVIQIDETPVRSSREIEFAVSQLSSEGLTLHVIRDGRAKRFEIRPTPTRAPSPPAQSVSPPASNARLERAVRTELERVRRRLRELESQLEALDQRAPSR